MSESLWAVIIGAIAGGLVSGVISVYGWRVAGKQSTEARRQEASLEHLRMQIEELYGPLYGLLQQSSYVWELRVQILPSTTDGQSSTHLFSEAHWRVWTYFVDNYFLTLNSQMREMMRSKIHLMQGGVMPRSFEEFLRHEVHYEGRHRLWRDLGHDTQSLPKAYWPADFEVDLKSALDALIKQHQDYLARIGGV